MKVQLQQLRKSKNLTQEEIANILDVKLSTYQKYERDAISPPYDTLIKIADFYGVTTDYLLGREPAQEPQLNKEDEEEVIARYLEFPPEQRAVLLEMLLQLGDAARKKQAERKIIRQTTVGAEQDRRKELASSETEESAG